ncbi:hypothetical protein E1A91_D01G209700v1 [Gossypium mustelinum]|uniref:YDG domain-containing protein n=1 Tax=Gossypium mustelinum TaxID=34275 RepID=A0A5D2W9C9_GOSMU|nr:hypothetical protein E1A91_D01G209700v1 [Gossypium mustelinum]
MVPSHRKPVKERALSKSNQARSVGKKKRHVKASYASEDENTTFTSEWNDCRRNIIDSLRCYKKLWKDKFSNQHKMSPEQGRCRGLALDGRVANILKVSGKWVNTIKQIGCFPGIKIGDEYHWRGDLGIISRVPCPNLTYTGEGENRDQMLEGGNLALKNNIHYKKPVRVIRKYNSDDNANASRYKFVYEGLYRVTRFDKEIESGFSVYKFQLDMLEDHQQYDSKWKQKRIWRH